MQNLFSIDQLFAQIFPWLSGISWDLGTVLIAIIFLWFIVLAFDWLQEMMLGAWTSHRYRKASDEYLRRAELSREARDSNLRGTDAWKQQDLVYQGWLRKSADASIKGWKK